MLFKKDYNELPTSIGVFPLDDVILLPQMHLTLNVFEPRYLNLLEYSFQNGRLLAITQPKQEVERQVSNPPLFEVGGLGRIVTFQEEEQRLLISLQGVTRVRLTEESYSDRGYRIFGTDYSEFADDIKERAVKVLRRDSIMPLLNRYFRHLNIKLSDETFKDIDDEKLIYSLAMLGNFSRLEKQALLECADIEGQAKILEILISMALQNTAGDSHDIV